MRSYLYRHKKVVIIAIAAIVVVAVSLYFYLPKGKVYGEVAGKRVDQHWVNSVAHHSKDISDKQAAGIIIDNIFYTSVAKKLNVTVSNDDIQKNKADIGKDKSDGQLNKLNAANLLYLQKIQDALTPKVAGKYVVANFTQHVPDSDSGPNPSDPQFQSDKAYADRFIHNLYSQVRNNNMSFDDAVNKEKIDPTLGEQAIPSLTHSGDFDTTKQNSPTQTLPRQIDVAKQLIKMKPGDISQPFEMSTVYGTKSIATAWMMIRLDRKQSLSGGLSFNDYISDQKQALGYRLNE